ncbi:thioredoxin family protein [Pedobacter gandavensis]|uniref:thioredoxin family protein n=1 Tax=Pedobacter gandavensis TaxID=2679963 RepID=UPI00292DC48E|nr:thioredoxin family protein [Pedobacter gandavensis]
MKKNLIGIFLLCCSLSVFSQGIEFEHGSWAEAVKKAKASNKLIFVDVYTSWCGPCKVMAAQVFTRPEVGAKFNQGFVNVKIDAEKGEGIALAKKYEVKSYPTYLFINPADESLFDRSKSSMAAADFNEVADRILTKFSGKPELNLSDLEAKFKKGDYDEAFARSYIKRLKAEKKPTREVLGQYLDKFVLKNPSADRLYFLGLNYPNGSDLTLYNYMIDHYKMIDAVLCENDGIAAATLYRSLRDETKGKIDIILNTKSLTAEKELELEQLFTNMNTVELEERKDKKVLEYKMWMYILKADQAQLLQANREYIIRFILPEDRTSSLGKESIVLNKNAPVPVMSVDSAGASDWCANYAIKLSKLSTDAQDKKLAADLYKKSLALNPSSVVKNKINVATYNFGDKKVAIKQQSKLIAEMSSSGDEYLADATVTLEKMKNNETNIPVFSYKRKAIKKH